MKLELISFKLCPFVQRSVIVLNHKNVEYKITYIDLDNPPSWFKEISPMGKVPVLKVDDEVLFESAVISEFIDEVTPDSLLSETALIRAKQRAWIELASDLNMDLYHLVGMANEETFSKKANSIKIKLERVAKVVNNDGWFSGTSLSLTDTAFAPFFMRVQILAQYVEDLSMSHPKIKKWANNLLGLGSVKKSVVPEFETMFIGTLKARSKYLANKIH